MLRKTRILRKTRMQTGFFSKRKSPSPMHHGGFGTCRHSLPGRDLPGPGLGRKIPPLLRPPQPRKTLRQSPPDAGSSRRRSARGARPTPVLQGLIVFLSVLLVLAVLTVGAYYYYIHYYCLPIERLEVVNGTLNSFRSTSPQTRTPASCVSPARIPMATPMGLP